jgi:hypothetical protein
MMIRDMLPLFEELVVAHNPMLSSKLQPGLSEKQIRYSLRRHRVEGDLEDVIGLYEWKNGTRLDPEVAASKKGFFPGSAYYLLDLQMALGHLGHTRSASRTRPELVEGTSYFPLFWDGSTGWITVDIRPSHHNAVILAQHREEPPFRRAYDSLYDFLQEAVQALKEDRRLVLG